MTDQTKRRLKFLGAFGALFAIIWFLWNTPFVYPVKLFVVLLHEISHGLAAVATGGEILEISVNPQQGGFCVCPGGNEFLTLSAGYLGSLLWGCLMIWGTVQLGQRTRWLTWVFVALLVIVTIVASPNAFTASFTTAFAAGLVIIALRASAEVNRILWTGMGMTSCLYALLDIKSDVLDRPELRSDARMLAESTHIPTGAWGVIWIGIGIAVLALVLRWAWKRA